MSQDMREFIISRQATLRLALETIDRNARGICFAVDEVGTLVGVLTDGDIRRAILAGATLADGIDPFIQRKCVSLSVGASAEQIQRSFSDRVKIVPLLDGDGCPVDIASFARFHRMPVLEPSLSGNELAYVTDCVQTGWISSQGAYVRKFEASFRDFIQGQHALAVSNGTVALHLAMEALGVGEGDEVIVPDLTFAASANAVIHAGATPVLVDVDAETWTMDVDQVRELITPRTKAIMPVHLYGHSCRMAELSKLCREKGLFMVEDCAESIGTTYEGRPTGSFGDVACFSFFGNKTITTGEGGMIVFRDAAIYENALVLRDHGMSKSRRYWHEHVGYNYRLTNLQAAIGVAQMEKIDAFVAAKRRIASVYDEFFQNISGISRPPNQKWGTNSYWLYTILVDSGCQLTRDELHDKLLLNGIETRKVFFPLHEMPPYASYLRPGQVFRETDRISRSGLCLPSSVTLGNSDVSMILGVLSNLLGVRSTLRSQGAALKG